MIYWMFALNLEDKPVCLFVFSNDEGSGLAGLNFILVLISVSSKADRIHLACIWVSVVIVRFLTKALLSVRRSPVFVFGFLDYSLAALLRRSIPITKINTEMGHPVSIPFSRFCHLVVWSSTLNISVIPRRYIPMIHLM